MIEQEFFDFSIRESPIDYYNLAVWFRDPSYFPDYLLSNEAGHLVQTKGDARNIEVILLEWQMFCVTYGKPHIFMSISPPCYP